MRKLISFILLVPFAIACDQLIKIDNSYDLTKLDTEVTVAGGITVPVNLNESIVLNDLLGTNSILTTDAQGNYRIQMNMDNQHLEYQIPEILINGSTISISQSLPLHEGIPDSNINLNNVSFTKSLSGSKEYSIGNNSIPEGITAFESIGINNGGSLEINISPTKLAGASIVAKAGSSVTLPQSLEGLACSNSNISVNGNVITFNNDTNIINGLSISLSFTSVRVPEGQGMIGPGVFLIEEQIEYNINIGVTYTGTLNYLKSNPFDVDLLIRIYDIQVENATVKLQKTLSLEEFPTIDINDLPSILNGGNAKIDLNDLNINLGIQNDLPTAFELSSKLSTYATGASKTHEFNLGPFNIQTGANTFSINESNTAGISKMLLPMPSEISLESFNATIDTPAPITIAVGHAYSISSSIGIDTPLAFGPEATLGEISHNLNGFEFDSDLDVSIDEATLKIKYINTIPLIFSLSATAITPDGVSIALTDKAGNSLSSSPLLIQYCTPEQKEELEIKIKGNNIKISDLQGLELVLSAYSSQELAGIELNKNQSIAFSDLQIVVDSGVTIGSL